MGLDPLWSSARLAIHFDGAEGSTSAIDLKGHAFTAYGHAHITTSDGVFGGSCAVFDGSGDYFRADAASNDWMFAYDDFSIAFWIKTTSTNRVILDFDDVLHNSLFQVLVNGAGCIEIWRQSILWFSGSIPVVDGGWHRVVVGNIYRPSSTTVHFISVDGVLCGSGGVADFYATNSVRIAIGAQVRYRDAAKDFVGYLDDLVIHIGACAVADAFAVPVSPFPDSFGLSPSTLLSPISWASISPPIDALTSTLRRSHPLAVDLENGGLGRIVGTTKNVGTPDYPVARRVRLLRKRDGQLVRETWSDTDGNYVFDHLRLDVEYVVLSHDHTGTYNAVIADSIAAEPMP